MAKTSKPNRPTTLLLVSLAMVLNGCTDDQPGPTALLDGGIDSFNVDSFNIDAATDAVPTAPTGSPAPVSDPADARAVLYRPGIRILGNSGLFAFTLTKAEPPPPTKGDSTWTLFITDAQGNGLSNLMVSVVPRMPDHGHGSGVKTTVVPDANTGGYVASPVRLFMAGYWATTITATTPDGLTDTARFGFLVVD
jgi:hypothetical protein